MTILFSIILLYLLNSTFFLSFPGPYADELLHAIPAVYIIKGNNICFSTFSIELFSRIFPLIQMSYLGAFKTYIFLPMFYLFSINIISVRLTTMRYNQMLWIGGLKKV